MAEESKKKPGWFDRLKAKNRARMAQQADDKKFKEDVRKEAEAEDREAYKPAFKQAFKAARKSNIAAKAKADAEKAAKGSDLGSTLSKAREVVDQVRSGMADFSDPGKNPLAAMGDTTWLTGPGSEQTQTKKKRKGKKDGGDGMTSKAMDNDWLLGKKD
jgi:uncharacterized membrane protein YdfJ with MMPL/SSD domain